MKTVALNKQSFAALHAVSKDQTRYNMSGLHVTPTYCQASNGHWLVRIGHKQWPAADLPEKIGATDTGEFKPVIIELDSCKQFVKMLPKQSYAPIMQNVYLQSNGVATCQTLDSKIEFKPIDGEFPDADQVIPAKDKTPVFKVAISAELLEGIAKTVKQFTDAKSPGVVFEFFDNSGPIRFYPLGNYNDQEFTGVVMPMKLLEVK